MLKHLFDISTGFRYKKMEKSSLSIYRDVHDLSYLEALKANQPHQSIKRPTRALVGLPIGGDPSISHLPNLGPSIHAAIKALDPPTK